MTEGKWTCSTDEEHWDCSEEFETRDEALAYVMNTHAPDYNVEDGCSVYIGQIKMPKVEDMASGSARADMVIDSMMEWLYENVGEFAQDSIEYSKVQETDLQARLDATVVDWLRANAIKLDCYLVDPVERHTWRQCEEKRTEPLDEPPGRCVLHVEHEGEHEWP